MNCSVIWKKNKREILREFSYGYVVIGGHSTKDYEWYGTKEMVWTEYPQLNPQDPAYFGNYPEMYDIVEAQFREMAIDRVNARKGLLRKKKPDNKFLR